MRVVIAGAGACGSLSIARTALQQPSGAPHRQGRRRGHRVGGAGRQLAGRRRVRDRRPERRPGWPTAMSWSRTPGDKVNLGGVLLAKTEFGVPRTVARVNNPKNSGCSTRHGASTSRCRRRAPDDGLGRRPWPWATWCGSSSSHQSHAAMGGMTYPRIPRSSAAALARCPSWDFGAGRDHPRSGADRPNADDSLRSPRRAAR